MPTKFKPTPFLDQLDTRVCVAMYGWLDLHRACMINQSCIDETPGDKNLAKFMQSKQEENMVKMMDLEQKVPQLKEMVKLLRKSKKKSSVAKKDGKYLVTLRYMHGDADHYENRKVVFNTAQWDEDAIEDVEKLLKEYHTTPECNNYEMIVSNENTLCWFHDKVLLGDVTNDCATRAQLVSYTVKKMK